MATFRYKAAGASDAGTIDAPDRAGAVRELLRRGVTPSALEPVDAPAGDALATRHARTFALAPSMSRAEFASFIRELSTALTAGLPLVQSLRTMLRAGSQARKRMLTHLIERVEHGRSLADAAQEWGRPFNDLTLSLIVAGEASGKLDEVLRQAAKLLDGDLKLRRAVVGATTYPAILALLIAGAIAVLVTFIVPSILEPLRGQMAQLPWPTRIVQDAASLFANYWWAILAALAALTLLARSALRDPAIRIIIDDAVLRVPLLGRLFRDLATARFTRTLATLTAAGIPALQALRITKGTLANKAMERVIDDVCEQVSAGKTIADPMEKSGYFPPMLVQIVNLGERSGRLDETLAQAADAFEERTQTSLKLLLTALPPLLVVILAAVVGFVVLAILLPLLDMQEAML